MIIQTLQCCVVQSRFGGEKRYDAIMKSIGSKAKWWRVRAGEGDRSELNDGILESKEIQVHYLGEINALDVGVLFVGRYNRKGDWRSCREKWWITADVGVEGVVETKIREVAVT